MFFAKSSKSDPARYLKRTAAAILGTLALILIIVAWFWSRTPDIFFVTNELDGEAVVVGYSTTDTLIRLGDLLLEKPGGYLSNDVAPPGVFLDNMPNWEFGVLTQIRDVARVMRNDYSRSQSQSTEDPDLAKAEPQFFFDSDSWILPTTESKLREGLEGFRKYRERLTGTANPPAQFFSRADNLTEWLSQVEKRLGSLSQRLSASVGQRRVNTDLQGEPSAASGGASSADVSVKTPWLELDDVFYEARGTAFALIHLLRAAEFDFRDVLDDKNAAVSVRQIIRELESSLSPMRSPVVLNGSGFGTFANHSLVMASFLSRANAAVIDLRELLDQG
ncbi:MAG: DUF2333 family protein [Pseudomonadota bacterium]